MPVTYELVHVSRSGRERAHPYTSEEPLQPGSLVHYEGRDWLAESIDGTRVTLKPARYRLKLRHPDGREELGALRRYRPDAPRVGHTFSTVEDGTPVMAHLLSLTPLRRIVKDYFMICDSYYKAIRTSTPSQIEAIDMGRRGLHNEGSELLMERLKEKIAVDFDTARRLFTLICVLHWKG